MARRRDPDSGRLLAEGVHPVVSDRTGDVTYRARVSYGSGKNRQHESRTFKHALAAEEWVHQRRLEMSRGLFEAPSMVTVEEYFDIWFLRRARDWSGSRQRSVQATWERYIEPELGHMRMTQVTRRHVQRVVDRIIRAGCSSRTARIYLVAVRAMFRDAIIDEVALRNPCHDLDYPKEQRVRRPTWSVLELRKFLMELQRGEYRFRAPMIFIAATGCRIGEALALHWEDIDFENNTVWIHRTLSSDATGKLQVVNRTKTSADGRVIPLPQWLQQEIRQDAAATGLVWSLNGKSILPTLVRTEYYQVIAKLGLKRIRIHDIRHTVGTLLHANNVDLRTIQDFLGHEHQRTTEAYLHPHLSVLRDGVEAVSRSLGYDTPSTTTSRKKEAI